MTHENDIVMPFIESGQSMLGLIQALHAQDAYAFDRAWVDRIQTQSLAYARRLSGMQKRYAAQGPVPGRRNGDAAITPREREALECLAQGLTREEIAAMMGITLHGVKKHIANIYTKLGAVNRVDAIHIAMSRGLIEG